jgi:hypothetical protein
VVTLKQRVRFDKGPTLPKIVRELTGHLAMLPPSVDAGELLHDFLVKFRTKAIEQRGYSYNQAQAAALEFGSAVLEELRRYDRQRSSRPQ